MRADKGQGQDQEPMPWLRGVGMGMGTCTMIPWAWGLTKKLRLSFMWMKDAISQFTHVRLYPSDFTWIMCS